MDKPTPVERIEDVREAICQIREFLKEFSMEQFLLDKKVQSAVLFQFVIIGEAIRNIEPSILKKYQYPWHIPISFRNFLTHEYHGIKMKRVYFAANDLDEIDRIMKMILDKEF